MCRTCRTLNLTVASSSVRAPGSTRPRRRSRLRRRSARSCCLAVGRAGSRLGRSKPTEQMVVVSKCMRAHGVSGFPDPTVGPPPSSPQEFSIAIGRGGVSLLVPKTIDVSSPAFKQAADHVSLRRAARRRRADAYPFMSRDSSAAEGDSINTYAGSALNHSRGLLWHCHGCHTRGSAGNLMSYPPTPDGTDANASRWPGVR